MERTFYYIDALPGAGKTEYFVNLADAHLRERKPGILIYVAPTHKLLCETLSRIVARGAPTSKVWMVMDNKGHDHEEQAPGNRAHWVLDPPGLAINYLLGLITRDEYEQTPIRVHQRRSCERTIKSGEVLFTTHETFLRVSARDRTGQKFALLRQAHVIFDEARDLILKNARLTLTPKDWRMFLNCMTTKRVKETRVKKDRSWSVLQIKEVLPIQQIMGIFGVQRKSLIPKEIRDFIKFYENYASSGRADIYALMYSSFVENLMSTKATKMSIHVLLRPSNIFKKYDRVTLTSAFLLDSKMYHFLKKDGHTFVDLMGLKRPPPGIQSVIDRHDQLKGRLHHRLEVAPLMKTVPWANRDSLSSYFLMNNWALPLGFKSGVIPDDFNVPPLWMLLRESSQVFRTWAAANKYKDKALLTTNVDSKQTWRDSVHYLSVIKSFHAYGALYGALGEDTDEMREIMSKSDYTTRQFVTKEWRRFFIKRLHVRSPDCIFRAPWSPKLYGVNIYSHLRAFIHLAALNPSPDQCRLYASLLPSYDIDLDHSIDNVVQMLYRTNLRDPKGKGSVLLIVAYASIAALLADKLGVDEFKMVHKPRLAGWKPPAKKRDPEKVKVWAALGGKAKRKYDPKFAAEANKLSTAIRRAQKQIAEAPNGAHELLHKRIKKWEREREACLLKPVNTD